MLSKGKVLRRRRVCQQNIDARHHALWKQFDAGELSARKLLSCCNYLYSRMYKTNTSKTMPFNSQLLDSGTPAVADHPADPIPCSSSVVDTVPLLDSGTPAVAGRPADPIHGSSSVVGAVPLLDSGTLAPLGVASDNDQAVTFASLMPIPHRERPRGKATRKRPPSYNLASDEHYEFVKKKMSVKSMPKPKGRPKGKGKAVKDTNRPTGSSGQGPPSAHPRRPRGKLPADGVSSKGKSKARKFGSMDTTPCGSCKERFCDDQCGEKWIQCQLCCKWFHNACQGIDSDFEQDTFICISCDDSD